jgi:predicted peroxiredoxin
MSAPHEAAARLVIVQCGGDATLALRYASTAAALDVAVELHVVGALAAQLRRDACAPALLALIRQAVELDVALYVCPLALSEHGLTPADLIEEVAGVRGAASLLVAGLAPGARFLTF